MNDTQRILLTATYASDPDRLISYDMAAIVLVTFVVLLILVFGMKGIEVFLNFIYTVAYNFIHKHKEN